VLEDYLITKVSLISTSTQYKLILRIQTSPIIHGIEKLSKILTSCINGFGLIRLLLCLKVVDSRPARSAGRVKKSCFKTLENYCVCYEGSVLSSKVIKVHPAFHADEFSISKNTYNANFTKIWLKQAF